MHQVHSKSKNSKDLIFWKFFKAARLDASALAFQLNSNRENSNAQMHRAFVFWDKNQQKAGFGSVNTDPNQLDQQNFWNIRTKKLKFYQQNDDNEQGKCKVRCVTFHDGRTPTKIRHD